MGRPKRSKISRRLAAGASPRVCPACHAAVSCFKAQPLLLQAYQNKTSKQDSSSGAQALHGVLPPDGNFHPTISYGAWPDFVLIPPPLLRMSNPEGQAHGRATSADSMHRSRTGRFHRWGSNSSSTGNADTPSLPRIQHHFPTTPISHSTGVLRQAPDITWLTQVQCYRVDSTGHCRQTWTMS